MAHVEELRQIHADINAMETIIKQAEESRRAAQVYIQIKGTVSRALKIKFSWYF